MTHSFDKKYWDEMWLADRAAVMAAGQPNPHLVQEIGDAAPGTALDAGCGAGSEAIWLAMRGWQVTAADIAADALALAASRAATSGVGDKVLWVQADLSVWQPDTQFDLVTTHYAHPAMPQLEFYDRIANWVAPRGTLFIVGHLHGENSSSAGEYGHGHTHDHQPPESASVTADAITSRLDAAHWNVVTASDSDRVTTGPDGLKATLRDVVVRAVRRS